jgi:hypothetical protein
MKIRAGAGARGASGGPALAGGVPADSRVKRVAFAAKFSKPVKQKLIFCEK